MTEYTSISKLYSAKRQLEMAIRLFLSNEDPIRIHTLSTASHTLIRDLFKKQGKESYIKDAMAQRVTPGLELLTAFNRENY